MACPLSPSAKLIRGELPALRPEAGSTGIQVGPPGIPVPRPPAGRLMPTLLAGPIVEPPPPPNGPEGPPLTGVATFVRSSVTGDRSPATGPPVPPPATGVRTFFTVSVTGLSSPPAGPEGPLPRTGVRMVLTVSVIGASSPLPGSEGPPRTGPTTWLTVSITGASRPPPGPEDPPPRTGARMLFTVSVTGASGPLPVPDPPVDGTTGAEGATTCTGEPSVTAPTMPSSEPVGGGVEPPPPAEPPPDDEPPPDWGPLPPGADPMAGDVLPDPDDPDPPELPPVEGAGSVGFGETTSATVSVTGSIGAVTAVGIDGFGAAPEVEVGVGLDVGVESVGAVPPDDVGVDSLEEPLEELGAEPPPDPPDDFGAFNSGALTCTPPTSSAWATPGTASAASNATTTVRKSFVLDARASAEGNIVDSRNPLFGHAAVRRRHPCEGTQTLRRKRIYT
jgi:hypothetical protein